MTKSELQKKIEMLDIYAWYETDMRYNIPRLAQAEKELLDLIKEVCESIIPKESDKDRIWDNRLGAIKEMKDNLDKLLSDETKEDKN